MAHTSVVAFHERSIKNIINGYTVLVGYPLHLVDEVYIPVNIEDRFHWVLVVVDLKDKTIRMFDSFVGSRHRNTPDEIERMVVMLLNYLIDTNFYEKKERTDWTTLAAHRDPKTGDILGCQYPFGNELVEDISHQRLDSM